MSEHCPESELYEIAIKEPKDYLYRVEHHLAADLSISCRELYALHSLIDARIVKIGSRVRFEPGGN